MIKAANIEINTTTGTMLIQIAVANLANKVGLQGKRRRGVQAKDHQGIGRDKGRNAWIGGGDRKTEFQHLGSLRTNRLKRSCEHLASLNSESYCKFCVAARQIPENNLVGKLLTPRGGSHNYQDLGGTTPPVQIHVTPCKAARSLGEMWERKVFSATFPFHTPCVVSGLRTPAV